MNTDSATPEGRATYDAARTGALIQASPLEPADPPNQDVDGDSPDDVVMVVIIHLLAGTWIAQTLFVSWATGAVVPPAITPPRLIGTDSRYLVTSELVSCLAVAVIVVHAGPEVCT